MKKIVTIQDISCVGKCSLTVALPIISSMGVETAVIPTALLSTHTAFKNFTYKDLSLDLPLIQKHWEEENFKFDAIYTGYLGSKEQISLLKDFFNSFKSSNNFIFVDPGMGDNGTLYKGFDNSFAKEMKELCSKADIIAPNITEATAMLGEEYREEYREDYVKDILLKLSNLGPKTIILTGVSFNKNEIGVMAYSKEENKFFSYFREEIDSRYHGTGDTFASACVGALVNGITLENSIKIAVDFVWESINQTYISKKGNAYGVDFELVLPSLIKSLSEAKISK